MASNLPKRIIADRKHLLASIISDMESMTTDDFINQLRSNSAKYANMEMVSTKKKKIVIGTTPFKLQSITPWTLYSSAYIDEHRGDEKLTLERCGVLRKEAAVLWKDGKVDHDIYNEKAKTQNNQNYVNWQEHYKDITISNEDLSAYLKSVDNIKVMKRKDLAHFCGLIPDIRSNTQINQSTTIKELRKLIIEVFKKINE